MLVVQTALVVQMVLARIHLPAVLIAIQIVDQKYSTVGLVARLIAAASFSSG
jgi:hypothetical protein